MATVPDVSFNDKEVKVVVVRDDGREFRIDGDWRIPNDGLENWANLPYTVNATEIPNYDGAIVTSRRVNSVDRTVTAVCHGHSDPAAARAEAIAFFNPKHSFKVYMTYMGRTRWCDCEQIGFMASEYNVYQYPQITWTVLCPNPYLQSVNDFGRDVAEVRGRFGFPWVSFIPNRHTNDWAVVGNRVFSQVVDLVNDADVPCGLRVYVTATGDVRNPVVYLGDGFVRVNVAMQQNDVLTIDTVARPPRVTYKHGTATSNVMHKVDRRSRILSLSLPVGTSQFSYDAEDGEQNMSVVLRFNKQYLGV